MAQNKEHTNAIQTTTQPPITLIINKQRPHKETNDQPSPPTQQITTMQIKEKLEQLKRKWTQALPESQIKNKNNQENKNKITRK